MLSLILALLSAVLNVHFKPGLYLPHREKKDQESKRRSHIVKKMEWARSKDSKNWSCSINCNTFREPLQSRMNTFK